MPRLSYPPVPAPPKSPAGTNTRNPDTSLLLGPTNQASSGDMLPSGLDEALPVSVPGKRTDT